jgi:hypothetical protein
MMPKILKDCLTNADGVTYCHSRCSGAITTVIYWVMGIAKIIMTHEIDFVAFASGYAAILVAVGGSAYLKKNTENS